MNLPLLRRPLLAIPAALTALAGLVFVVVAAASIVANSTTFAWGIAAVLAAYGAGLVLIAWLVTRGHEWALGLIVASSLLHALAIASFLTSEDRTQVVIMAVAAPFVLATVITSVLAVGRGELRDDDDAAR